LNTTDLALVRLISNFENRQVILFINRIDELPSPSEQVPEIRKSIMETLDASNAAENTQVLFGSARWAELALTGDFSTLGDDDKAALLDWAKAVNPTGIKDSFTHMWVLSGVPDLMKALNERILEGSGKRLLDGLRAQLANLSKEAQAEEAIAGEGLNVGKVDVSALRNELDTLIAASRDALKDTTDKLIGELRPRLEKVQESFVSRATEALVQHLNQHGEQEAWTYSSTGLRLVLRSTYARFALVAKKEVADVYAASARSVENVYSKTLGVNIEGFKIEPPVPPRIPPPIVLGKTIALDLSSGWWKKWWQKRKGVENFTEDYSRLIRSEVGSIIQELESSQIAEVFEEMQNSLEEFLSEQRDTILRLAKGAGESGGATELPKGQEEFRNALGEILNALEGAAA
ncbi:MAG: hypothetical protein OEZ19_11170, partial [Paracoccaceae bacterium]|nr:hypothetical protein [Paracoccaceae bacterium]